ncbi:MAG: radical SAM family heme chaperone HemW [Paracoccaceae bacterium]
MSADWQNGGFGIYIHWPFCLAKCPYCDFNSHVRRQVDHAAWQNALITELRANAALTGRRHVRSIFFGGGTPSLMPPALVGALIDEVAKLWVLEPDAEITLEANPTSVEAERFRGFAAAGVNRISMGIQALNDPDLKALGRMHSTAEAMQAFDIARSLFKRVSFDLIYARQNQTLAAWEAELGTALKMAVDHLSLYQLTIEDGTRFGELAARGKLRGLPSDDLGADMYELTQSLCDAAGMPCYEVSNHARAGAESRHNLVYWRYGDYAGVGPGAHGRLSLNAGRFARENLRNPEAWLARVAAQGHGGVAQTLLSAGDEASEYLLMSMRLVEGCDIARYSALAGHALNMAAVADCVNQGLLVHEGTQLATTARGRIVLNAILREISP